MRGGKPQPQRLRLLKQNPNGHRVTRVEPTPDPCPTAVPDDLTSPIARDEWTRTIVPAIQAGIVTAADRVLAIAHCELWATWRSLLADVAASPLTVKSPSGYVMAHPSRTQANKTLQLLIGLDERLGFSPTSRSRVDARPPMPPPTASDRRRAKFFDHDRG